jgi:peroxiredoxin
MPSMERLYRRHRERGFTIVAVSLDTGGEAVVATFVKRLGLTFPIGLDAKLEVADRYAIRALPSSLLIDRAGRTVAVAIGPRDWDSPAAHAVIEAMLGEAAGAASTGPAARIAVFGIAQSVVICHDI